MIILFLVEVGFFLTLAGSDFFALLRNLPCHLAPGCMTSRSSPTMHHPMP
jgi:hypothetical protein